MKESGSPQPSEARGNGGKRWSPWLAGGLYGFIVLILLVATGRWANAEEPPQVVLVRPSDIVDPADPNIGSSSYFPSLVQFGTDHPYAGSGAPGIRLVVESPSDVIGWTIEAWANATVPPSNPQVCASESVHFSPTDWRAISGGQTNTTANTTFETVPTTDTQRVGPNGDQCMMRLNYIGVWRLTVLIEGEPVADTDRHGRPRGIYDAPDGRHIDDWDYRVERLVQVPA